MFPMALYQVIADHDPAPDHASPGASGEPAPDTRILSRRLAEANLARIRGNWDVAEARCIDALRMDPGNLEAHSLLGDLYRDQNRLEDAAQWYRLSLDIDPSSESDRARLAAVEHEILRRAHHPHPRSDGGSLTTAVGTQRLLGASPVVWMRILTVGSIVFTVAVGGLLMSLRNRQGVVRRAPPATGSPVPTVPAPPPALAARPGPSDLTDRPDAPAASMGPAMTVRETQIARHIAALQALSPGTMVGSVTVAAQDQSADVVLVWPSARGLAPGALRQAVLADAEAAANAAFSIDGAIERVAVRVRVRAQDGTIEDLFSGTMPRPDRQAGGAPGQGADFQNPTWAPDQRRDTPSAEGQPPGGAM